MGLVGNEIGLSEYCDILEQSLVIQSVDLGSAVVHQAEHQKYGNITLVNTSCGRSVMLKR